MKPPTTFLSLPAEIRNEIYIITNNLHNIQAADLGHSEDCSTQANQPDLCVFCIECNDGTSCRLCLDHPYRTKELSLWVNRNSAYADEAHRSEASKQSLRHPNTTHAFPSEPSARVHGAHIEHGVEQPPLTKVCHQFRNDTLPIFYGTNSFMFTIFDRKIDVASIFKWSKSIGPRNVALLRMRSGRVTNWLWR